MKGRNVWRALAILLIVLGLAAFLYSRVIWDRYLRELPKKPNAEEHRVYPLNIHGIIVFQTLEEEHHLWLFDRGGITVFFLGLLLGGVSDRFQKRASANPANWK